MNIKNKLIALFIILQPLGLAYAMDPTVSFNPFPANVKVGETVSIEIIMQDFPLSEGGGIAVTFNPHVAQVTGIEVYAATWSFAHSTGIIDNDAGRVSDILFSSFTGVSGNAPIATVQFQAIKAGKVRLALEESSQNPFASSGKKVSVTFESDAFKVSSSGGKKGKP